MPSQVTLYALSTCGWCKKTKTFLESNDIEFVCHYVDTLSGDEKEQAREAVAKVNPRRSYPTLVVDEDKIVVGYDEDKLREVLGL
jgi:glutaredoxin-like protein NrdH